MHGSTQLSFELSAGSRLAQQTHEEEVGAGCLRPWPPLPPPAFEEIRARWAEDGMGALATPEAVARAVNRTGNGYGLTSAARPYLHPQVGMHAKFNGYETGRIEEVLTALSDDGDPEVRIVGSTGRTYYGFQTAVLGYHIIIPDAAPSSP